MAIPSPLWHTKTLMFDRTEGRDFTERDRLVLNRLQPHLMRLTTAARTRRLLKAALAELDRTDENDARGVILVDVGGEIDFASPPAHRLLRQFFPAATVGQLPDAVTDWLDSGAKQPLIRRRRDRLLSVQRTTDALVLVETHAEAELTAREREVLAWVPWEDKRRDRAPPVARTQARCASTSRTSTPSSASARGLRPSRASSG